MFVFYRIYWPIFVKFSNCVVFVGVWLNSIVPTKLHLHLAGCTYYMNPPKYYINLLSVCRFTFPALAIFILFIFSHGSTFQFDSSLFHLFWVKYIHQRQTFNILSHGFGSRSWTHKSCIRWLTRYALCSMVGSWHAYMHTNAYPIWGRKYIKPFNVHFIEEKKNNLFYVCVFRLFLQYTARNLFDSNEVCCYSVFQFFGIDVLCDMFEVWMHSE